MTAYSIYLNAKYDLSEAGLLPTDPDLAGEAVASFEGAYCTAAADLAERAGIEIEVTCGDGEYGDRMSERDADLWDHLHHEVEQIGPAEWRPAPGPVPAWL